MKTSDLHIPMPKISKRLKMLLIIEATILFAAYGFIIYSHHHIEQQKAEKSIQQLNYSLLETIQYSINTLDILTKSPLSRPSYAVAPTLWSYLTSPSKITENPWQFESLFINTYHQINLLFPDLNSLFLFSPSGEVLAYKYNNTHYFLLENLDYNTWVKPIRDKGGSISFFTKGELKALGYDINGNVLFAGRQLNNLTSNNPACITIAGLDISDISMAFERHKIFDTQQFACFDSDGKLLFSSKGLNNLSFETIKNQSDTTDNGIYYQVLKDKNFNLYSVIATKQSDIINNYASLSYIFIFLPVILLSSLLVSIHIIRNVLSSYKKMSDKIYMQSITEKDLNLQMLRSQINPHFLYNTLDTMRMASMNSGYDYLAEMCELLAKILRYGVSDTSNIVTVQQECLHLEEYIRLIRLRYPNIDVHTYIEPSIMHCNIIKLLLQPLVENSVNHGLENSSAQGTIQIWGYKSNKKLIFTVSDNGNGMPEEQLDLLRDYLDDKNTAFKSIGLKNIKKRIQLYYGSEYDLIIESQLYQGTAVTVTLPVIEENSILSERISQ